MLNQATNSVKIEGILSEVDLKEGSYVKDGKTHENINGSIKIRVSQKINGEDVELDIPVYMFANKLKNNGQPNPAYESISHVLTDYTSIAAGGIDSATRVRITNGNIRMNEYYSPTGNLNSYPRINASFISQVTNKFSPEASFEVSFMVGNAGYKTDSDGVEDTNKYMIRGILPQYGGNVDVVDFMATNPNVINAVSSYWTEGDTVKAVGKLNFTSTVEEKKVEVDFGEPRIEKRTVTVSELIITGGTQTPLSGDFAFDGDEIQQALEARQARLADMKEKAKKKAQGGVKPAAKKPSFSDLGF